MSNKVRATALPNSPTLSQLRDTSGPKLTPTSQGSLPSKQRVGRSNRPRDAFVLEVRARLEIVEYYGAKICAQIQGEASRY